MTTRRNPLRTAGLAVLTCLLAVPAAASGPMQGVPGGARGNPFAQPLIGPAGPSPLNPAGPSPLNPAGPSPLNPAGPSPLDPTGRSIGLPRRGARIQQTVLQPGVVVGVVGNGGNVGAPLQGSFYCQVHNRGYATQSLFFDHLAVADGVAGDEATSVLVQDGGVWIFPVE